MYTHISRDDRIIIANSLSHGESYAVIARYIGRNKGAVWREVIRNRDPDGTYNARRAHKRARQRREHAKRRTRKIENDPMLEKRIESRLEPLVSPEVVAYENGIAHETIYAWISRSRPDLKTQLPQRGRKRRRYGSKRAQKQGWTRHVRSIDERTETGESWEGDTMRGSTRSRLLTHVERGSLFTRVDVMPDGTADSVHAHLLKTPLSGEITYDRGSEFALWRLVERDTDMRIFFADPHAPWQRPKNENTNGRIRRVFHKRCDFSSITQKEIDKTVWTMNHTPRKSLSWRTPCAVYGKCCTSS